MLDDALDNHPSTWDLLPQLSDDQVLILLDFAMNLADEAKKLSTSPKSVRSIFPQTTALTLASRKVHHEMIANAESLEALLHASFGRGFKYLSIPINDASYNEAVQQGEKICVAASKCFIVSPNTVNGVVADVLGLDLLCTNRVQARAREAALSSIGHRARLDLPRVSC